MDRERLRVLSFEALQDIAHRSGVADFDDTEKETLIDQILEALEEERTDRMSSNNIEMLVKEKKFELGLNDGFDEADPDEYVLPDGYGKTLVTLLMRDPSWAFAYWDLSDRHAQEAEEGELGLRVYVRSADIPGDRADYFDIPIRNADRKWYFNLPRTGREYYVELIVTTQSHVTVLCRSNSIHSPEASIVDLNNAVGERYISILSVAGVERRDDTIRQGGIPQRIISLLDTQYLHLKS